MNTAPQPGEHGRILTVFAAKGGCGKTTLATNLAVVLNAAGARRVCLVDLDLASGDVASMLALEPDRSLVDAVGAGPLDAATVSSLVTPVWPSLDCILAPAAPGGAAEVPSSLVEELLAILPSMYDYVVVDTPAQFSAHVLAALDSSHQHVLLTTPERPALQNLRLTLDMLDMLGYRRESRSVVLNRCDSRVGLTADDVEKAIKHSIAGELPSGWDVSASINHGVPLTAAAPGHRFSLAVNRFVENHVTTTHSASPAEPRWPW